MLLRDSDVLQQKQEETDDAYMKLKNQDMLPEDLEHHPALLDLVHFLETCFAAEESRSRTGRCGYSTKYTLSLIFNLKNIIHNNY